MKINLYKSNKCDITTKSDLELNDAQQIIFYKVKNLYIFNHRILNNPFVQSLPKQIDTFMHGEALYNLKKSKIKFLRGNFF